MSDREKVIKALRCWVNEPYVDCTKCDYYDGYGNCVKRICNDALELLKELEQGISRLKHHIDCDAAEKLPSGCVGYGRSYYDDEPCETCKKCEKYNGYGEE